MNRDYEEDSILRQNNFQNYKEQTKKNRIDYKYAFRQQLLKAWRPMPTNNKCTIAVFFIISLIFFILGIIIKVESNTINEKMISYHLECSDKQVCNIPMELEEDFSPPIYVYYRIVNFYQNHGRYIKSINYDQLRGKNLTVSQLSNCEPALYNKDFPVTVSVEGNLLDPEAVAIPCGVAARAFFNDTFTLINSQEEEIEISSIGIAWETDNENFDLSKQWIDMTDERFITWMKISPFSDFRKGWGIINEELKKGEYVVSIGNNWNANLFKGEKYLILSQSNLFGGKNEFLAFSYIGVGALSLILGLVFLFLNCKKPKGILNEVFEENNTQQIQDD